MRSGRVVASRNGTYVHAAMARDPKIRREPVKTIVQKVFRHADIETRVTLPAPMLTPEQPAWPVTFPADGTCILTGYDVLAAL